VSKVKGTYRGGRIELDEAVDWPDGRRVTVSDEDPADELLTEGDWPDTPENRAELVRRLDALEPLGLTSDEQARIEAALAESKRFNVEAVRKQMGLSP
jgi:hypothetical protein